MRELLFSGKSIKNGEWVTGKGVDVNWKDAYIIIPQIDGTVGWCGVDEIEVDPTTICQYTGLKDKNEKKIFEGDIVEFESHGYMTITKKGEVVFYEGGYHIKWIDERHKTHGFCYEKYHRIGEVGKWQDMGASGEITYTYEVIGNIYDNSELLETTK